MVPGATAADVAEELDWQQSSTVLVTLGSGAVGGVKLEV